MWIREVFDIFAFKCLTVYICELDAITDFPAHSDTLGTVKKCQYIQIVKVSRDISLTNALFGNCLSEVQKALFGN